MGLYGALQGTQISRTRTVIHCTPVPSRHLSNLHWFVIHFDLAGDLQHVDGEVADGLGVVRARLGKAAHRHVLIAHSFHLC